MSDGRNGRHGSPADLMAAVTVSAMPGRPGRIEVEVGGELDLASREQFEREVLEAAGPDARVMVLDASRLGFVDVQGLMALMSIRDALAARGCRLVVANPSRCLSRLLQLTNTLDRLSVA